MKRFVEGADRAQSTLLPECLADYVEENNPVRAVDAFVEALDLAELPAWMPASSRLPSPWPWRTIAHGPAACTTRMAATSAASSGTRRDLGARSWGRCCHAGAQPASFSRVVAFWLNGVTHLALT